MFINNVWTVFFKTVVKSALFSYEISMVEFPLMCVMFYCQHVFNMLIFLQASKQNMLMCLKTKSLDLGHSPKF